MGNEQTGWVHGRGKRTLLRRNAKRHLPTVCQRTRKVGQGEQPEERQYERTFAVESYKVERKLYEFGRPENGGSPRITFSVEVCNGLDLTVGSVRSLNVVALPRLLAKLVRIQLRRGAHLSIYTGTLDDSTHDVAHCPRQASAAA